MRVRCQVGEWIGAAPVGTLDHFLIERYMLHVERGPTLWTVQVHHAPYPLRRARVLNLNQTLVDAAGIPTPDALPLTHFAAGVDVEIFRPRVAVRGERA